MEMKFNSSTRTCYLYKPIDRSHFFDKSDQPSCSAKDVSTVRHVVNGAIFSPTVSRSHNSSCRKFSTVGPFLDEQSLGNSNVHPKEHT
jgi:hypothetical protein